MSVIHSLYLCSVIDLIESCNLHVYGPQLYTPCICGQLYFLISIKIALLIKSIIKNCVILWLEDFMRLVVDGLICFGCVVCLVVKKVRNKKNVDKEFFFFLSKKNKIKN